MRCTEKSATRVVFQGGQDLIRARTFSFFMLTFACLYVRCKWPGTRGTLSLTSIKLVAKGSQLRTCSSFAPLWIHFWTWKWYRFRGFHQLPNLRHQFILGETWHSRLLEPESSSGDAGARSETNALIENATRIRTLTTFYLFIIYKLFLIFRPIGLSRLFCVVFNHCPSGLWCLFSPYYSSITHHW